MSSKTDESVKVVVRIRPMNNEEIRNGNLAAAEANSEQCAIILKNPKAGEGEPVRSFTFDAVFGQNDTQKHIYDVCAYSMVESVLGGYNGTFFAYGQTGAGKTHTMEGRPDPPSLRGIIPNSFQHIFEHVSTAKNLQFLVRASYLEIYNEEIRDLLVKESKNLELKENIESGVYVKDLTSIVVKNVSEIDFVMQTGKTNRTVGATNMNATSSRSHSIFTIVIECMDAGGGGDHIRVGKLNLVDLAGSERQSKTGATGERLNEAKKINFSLTALGNVINALVDGKSSHIPYRDSKLTRLLQNSLGGNAKTVMCANCGPADYNYDETLSTLRYANRAKNIKNKPKINEDPKDAMLREYQDEIKRLKEQLEATQRGMVIDESGKQVMMHNAKQEIVEKIVEREVIKEVKVGVSEQEMEEIRRKADEEKRILMKQAQDDMKQLIEVQSRTAQERAELQSLLDKEGEDRRKIQEQKEKLALKLKSMEEQLLKGGEVMTKVNEQEVMLRRAEQELRERSEMQSKLARDLAEKEEMNLQLEDHFSSLQEEVEVKTKKLRKIFAKYQSVVRDNQDLEAEFQRERSELLDTIRQLTADLKLKETIISNFIPEDYSRGIEKRAQWNAEEEMWIVPKIELSGNRIKSIGRPISSGKLRRPESEYARQRKQYDNNPRYRYDNIASMELDMPEKTTQAFEGPGMVSRVDNILAMPLNGEDGEDINVEETGIGNPYLQYGGDGPSGEGATAPAEKKSKGTKKSSSSSSSSSSSAASNANSGNNYGSSNTGNTTSRDKNQDRSSGSRPKSASRRREESSSSMGGSSGAYNVLESTSYKREEEYPTARGLVGRR